MSIASAITALRTKAALSQQELADRLYVSRELVSKWETGSRIPDFGTIGAIAGVFRVSPEAIADRNALVFRELSDCVPQGISLPEEELTGLLERFLTRIPVREGDVFLNRYYFLKNTAEIAAKYRLGENHVRSILSKTRRKLAKYLKEELS
ncbi:MAG: helix-turn-helix transcriptional regulator [Clostridia bacterium]|nr:helix-turn-helix transcriptional regulator [Clostridia bacterium]